MLRSSAFQKVLALVLALSILCYSAFAPRRAQAVVASSTIIGAAIVAACATIAGYESYNVYKNNNNLSDAQAKASIALAQLVYATQGVHMPDLATKISDYSAAKSLINGFKNAGTTAWEQFNTAADTMQSKFGETWFNFSGLTNIYVSSLESNGTNWRSGTVTFSSLLSASEKANYKNYFDNAVCADYAMLGISGADLIDGTMGDVLLTQPTWAMSGIIAQVHGYCEKHQCAFDMQCVGTLGSEDLVITSSHIDGVVHDPLPVTNTYTLDLPIEAGQFVDTTNPSLQPKKAGFPPFWFNTSVTPEASTPSEDYSAGENITTNPNTGEVSDSFGLSSIYGAIKNIGSSISTALEPLFNALGEFFRPYLNDISGSLRDVKDSILTFPETFTNILDSIETIPQRVSDALGLETIPQTLDDIKTNILTFPQTVADAISKSLETFPQSLENIKSTIIEKGDLLVTGLSTIGSYLAELGSTISNALINAWGATWGWIQSLLETMGATLTNIWEWCQTLVDSFVAALTSVFVPSLDYAAEINNLSAKLETKFPFGVPAWFKVSNNSSSASWQRTLVFYDGQHGKLSQNFDFLANKDKYSELYTILSFFIYGLGVVAAYRMLRPKVTV